MLRSAAVLSIFPFALALEPALVLLAVGHGGTCKERSREVRICQGRSSEVRFREVCLREVRVAEVGFLEVGFIEGGSSQIG
jgi:hypothetical protein